MWKASAGHKVKNELLDNCDDWETDPDFVNDVTEQEQRWGSKTIDGCGRTAGTINMQQLREETEKSDQKRKKKEMMELNPGYGYGGKFGVQTDRMDKSAMGHDYVGKKEKYTSQKDYTDGFEGKFGVQIDRVDKSAVDWDYNEKTEKHSSQKDYATGFGGKFDVQSDRVDKSALGWDFFEKIEKHEPQKDYSKGFGGKFGVQEDRKDKSAVGWDRIEKPQKHESQLDHKVGFGGIFGVQKDQSLGFDDKGNNKIGTSYTKVKPYVEESNMRAKFEHLANDSEERTRKRLEEQTNIREKKDQRDYYEAAKKKMVENAPRLSLEEARPMVRTTSIKTGRTSGIGSAINALNKMRSPTDERTFQQKEPVVIQRDAREPILVITVDELEPQLNFQRIDKVQPINKPFYQNKEEVQLVDSPQPQNVESIYANTENLNYIEETGIKATALYDYQAADDDEISFDPDDIITHIEMIDEGWWRGICKNRQGLFPANYVQLIKQQEA